MRPNNRASREDKFSVGARFVLNGLTGLALLGAFFGLSGDPADYSGFMGLHRTAPSIQLCIDVAGWFVLMGIGGYWLWTLRTVIRRVFRFRFGSSSN